MKKVKQRIL